MIEKNWVILSMFNPTVHDLTKWYYWNWASLHRHLFSSCTRPFLLCKTNIVTHKRTSALGKVNIVLKRKNTIAGIKKRTRNYNRNHTYTISNELTICLHRDSDSQSRCAQSPVERDATSAGLSTGDWWPRPANQRLCYSKVVNPQQ